MIKTYFKKSDIVEYKAIQYDGTEECLNLIKEMCRNCEAVQEVKDKGIFIGTMDGTDFADIGDYIVCGDKCCLHPVREDQFWKFYGEMI